MNTTNDSELQKRMIELDFSQLHMIVQHMRKAAGLAAMPTQAPHQFAALLTEDDDASTGDAFLQCCLFGEVIFG